MSVSSYALKHPTIALLIHRAHGAWEILNYRREAVVPQPGGLAERGLSNIFTEAKVFDVQLHHVIATANAGRDIGPGVAMCAATAGKIHTLALELVPQQSAAGFGSVARELVDAAADLVSVLRDFKDELMRRNVAALEPEQAQS